MTENLTLSEFEALLTEFGSDIALWPERRRTAGELFSATAEAKLVLAADHRLEDMFVTARAIGPETASDGNSDAFLDRLMDVPVYYHQEDEATQSRRATLWIKALFEGTVNWLSPKALASEAAVFVVVLGMGVFVGFNSEQTLGETVQNDYATIDISETLFASGSDFELDEQ